MTEVCVLIVDLVSLVIVSLSLPFALLPHSLAFFDISRADL